MLGNASNKSITGVSCFPNGVEFEKPDSLQLIVDFLSLASHQVVRTSLVFLVLCADLAMIEWTIREQSCSSHLLSSRLSGSWAIQHTLGLICIGPLLQWHAVAMIEWTTRELSCSSHLLSGRHSGSWAIQQTLGLTYILVRCTMTAMAMIEWTIREQSCSSYLLSSRHSGSWAIQQTLGLTCMGVLLRLLWLW